MTPNKENIKKEKIESVSSKVDVGAILRKKPWVTAIVAAIILAGIILLYISAGGCQQSPDTGPYQDSG